MKYKKILLTKNCEALNLALQDKVSQNEKFLYNYSDNAGTPNSEIRISADWNSLDYIITKENIDINNIKPTDILIYIGFDMNKPSPNVRSLQLISFCEDINFVKNISGDIIDSLYTNYKTNIINFSGVEGGTTYKLFNMIYNDEKLANRLFPNWYGRYVGYKTDAFIHQDMKLSNLHYFEIIRK